MPADLHVHSTASDGTASPIEIIEDARSKEIDTLSFVDHESTCGYLEAQDTALASGIRVIPGIELLTFYQDREIHLLGYYIDVYSSTFNQRLGEIQQARNVNSLIIVDRLRTYGFDLDWNQVKILSHEKGVVGKNHLIKALAQAGYIQNSDQAIDMLRKYLSPKGLAYEEYTGHSFGEAVELIRQAGGYPVIAHPGLIRDDDIVQQLLKFSPIGLEVFYYYLGPDRQSLIDKYYSLARERKLVMTGGSDYHGNLGPVHLGDMMAPDDAVSKLEAQSSVNSFSKLNIGASGGESTPPEVRKSNSTL
ncbi:MAG: PHP domain-containing protein [Bacillota bacterium]